MTLNLHRSIIIVDDLKSTKNKKGDCGMTDSNALRDMIKSKGLKLKFVAEQIGLTTYGLQLKIDNKNEFKTGEVSALCELLGISDLKTKESIFFRQ